MTWVKPALDQGRVREIAPEMGLGGHLDYIAASIAVRRGLDGPDELKSLLSNDLSSLHNPFLFQDMEEAVDRVLAAREEGERVLVFGDRDVDGITATTILVEALTELGVDVEWRLPVGDEAYGLTTEVVEDFAARDGTLVITVDCGISNAKEVQRALDLGVDTIVVDHHVPPEALPPALAIINPRVEEETYPFRGLAGCGVAAKLVWSLRFATTPLYNETIVLLNVVPGNGTYIIDALRMRNLVELERVRENLVPGKVRLEDTRLATYFRAQIFAYDAKPQEVMLRELFGKNVEIALYDVAPEVWKVFPQYAGKSLLRLRELSKAGRASSRATDLDSFRDLFLSYVLTREAGPLDGFDRALDLVALGTVADLMPLRGENRAMVRRGLKRINAMDRPALRELLRSQNAGGRELSGKDLGWTLGPLINATGRMGKPDTAVRLFLSTDAAQHLALAAEIGQMNQERKRLGEEGWQHLLPSAKASLDRNSGKLVFVATNAVPRGLTGILAARLVNRFSVPAVVCAVLEDKVVGSLRSARGYRADHFLEGCADLLEDYGGHDFAAGFNLKKEALASLEERVAALAPDMVFPDNGEALVTIDAELPPNYLGPDIEKVVDLFAPYGEDNQALVFQSQGVEVIGIDLVGREQMHVRLTLKIGQHPWPAVFWNSADRVDRDYRKGDLVDIAYTVEKNHYQNMKTLQLSLIDLRRHGAP